MTLSIEENFFTDTDSFGSDDGLAVAAIFLPRPGIPIDPERGELVFYSFSWDSFETSGSLKDEIPSHSCTDEEFGFNKTENSRFYPMNGPIKERIEMHKGDWKCIPREQTKVLGTYDSDNMKRIDIRINKKCSKENNKGCSDDYFKGGNIILIINRIRFDNKLFG